jgi:Flp pilus assembly protein TadD
VADNPRIDDLRKRLEREPGSRLFAQLAEELRKAGEFVEAIQVCREGLQKHPSYTSARMTLGRSLMDTGDLTGAKGEFEAVVKAAADNILASRLLGECLEGLGDLAGALARYKTTLALAPGDKQVVARIEEVSQRQKGPAVSTAAMPGAAAASPAAPALPDEPAPTLPGTPFDDMAPIPLVAADEAFELEAAYEAPPTKVGTTAPPPPVAQAAAPEIEESFDLEPPYASPPTVLRDQMEERKPDTIAFAPAPVIAPAAPAPAIAPAAPAPAAQIAESFELEAPYASPPTVLRDQMEERKPDTIAFAPAPVIAPALTPPSPPEPAPELASSTLAELYFNQGHTSQAIEVYRQLVEREPGSERVRARLAELEALERHLEAEERHAVAEPPAALSPQAVRRAAIERVIGKLERLREATRRGSAWPDSPKL